MRIFKTLFIPLSMFLLMTACNTGVVPEPPMPTSTTIPVEPPSTPLPTETKSVTEPMADEPDLIAVKFIDSERVIPAALDPTSQSQEMVSQYLQTTGDGSNLWAGGSIQGSNFYSLEILPASYDLPELISVTFPLYLNVTKTTDSLSDANIIFPTRGGGGGNSKFFPSLPLQEGSFELMPDEPAPVILMKDVQQLFYFFDMPCVQTGVFDLQFSIPYSVTRNMVTQESIFEYTIQLACPESATLWLLSDPNAGQIENGGTWIFQGGRYVPQQ